jgi:TonB-linked SusC/RagA family outer membrane protein
LTNESTMHNINNPVQTYSQSLIDQYQSGALPSTNWTDAVLKKTAPQTQHNLTVSGGTDKVNYFLSGGFQNQDGLFRSGGSNYDKYNVRSNIEAKIADHLTASLQLSGISDVTNQVYDPNGGTWDIFGYLWRVTPNYTVYANNDPAYINNIQGLYNPVALSTPSFSGYRQNKNHYFNGSLSLAYDVPFVPGLQLKALYSYDYTTADNKAYQQAWTQYDPILPATTPATYTSRLYDSPSSVSRTYGETGVGFMQFSLNYNHVFAKVHTIQFLALYEERTTNSDNFSAYRQEILNSDQLAAGNATNQTGTQNLGGVGTVGTKSFVSRIHYDYKSKYLLDVTGRYDGSVLGAYRLSEESFFKNSKSLSFIDNVKIRASYGVLGDAAGANGYNFLAGYNYPASGNAQTLPGGSVFDGGYTNGVGFRGLTNPNITWYTAKETNFGLDADFWKGLFGFQVDVYNRNRSGLLATRLLSLPGTVGAALPQENLNSDQTRGIELVLTSRERVGEVGLNFSGNISYARTKWGHYEAAPQGNDYADWYNSANKSGRYNDVYWGYGYVGQYQSFNQIRAYAVNNGGGNRSAVPGDYIYQDYNHDGYFDSGDLHPVAVTAPINVAGSGNPSSPLINYGLTMQANYKNFDVTALIQGVSGRYVSYSIDLSYPLDHGGNAYSKFLDRWHPTDPTANPFNPNTAYTPGYYAYTGTNINQQSTGPGAIASSAYVRLKSVELGYTLPFKFIKKVGLSRLRIYANGFDLLTITGLKGEDPEHTEDLYGDEYPLVHTYNIGLNATF